MTDAEKLTALADEIAAGFTREPWRDQRGMGYVEVQMDRADEEEYREMAAHIAQLEAERDALAAALVKARDLAGTASCYEVDAALSTEAGSDVFGSPGIARKSLVKRAKNAWAEFDAIIDGDPAAILAARDKEKDEKIAALAAALEPFVRFAKQVSSSPNWVPDGCPVNVDPGGISDLAVGAFRRAEQALADPAAILAARDARMKREGAIEALRGLPMNKP